MASTSENAKKTFVLRTSDGHTFELEEAAARMSETIKNMIEDDCAADVIPLPNVDAATLTKVAEFCKRHTVKVNADDNQQEKEELTKFDEKFIDDVKDNQQVLFDLILAANYLSIKELLNLTCQCVADMIKGKTPEEIRAHFHIKNDYTPELEAEVRRENAWAFE